MKYLEWKSPTSQEVWEQFGYCKLGYDFSEMIEKKGITLSTELYDMFDNLVFGDLEDLPLFEYWSVPVPDTVEEIDKIKTVQDLCDYVSQRAKALIVPTSDSCNQDTIFEMLKLLIIEDHPEIDTSEFEKHLVDSHTLFNVLCIIHRSFPINNQWELEVRNKYTTQGRLCLLFYVCCVLMVFYSFYLLTFNGRTWIGITLFGLSFLAQIIFKTSITTELKSVEIKGVHSMRDLAKKIDAIICHNA